MGTATFDLARHAGEYQYDYVTVIDNIMSDEMCRTLRARNIYAKAGSLL